MTGFQAPRWIVPSSPEELLNKIPMATPVSTAMIPVPGYRGCFKFDVELMLSLPVMDWSQHFELGRQAATGEWKPQPGIAQVPAQLPGPDLMPLDTIPEVERVGGFQLSQVPDMTGKALTYTAPAHPDPTSQMARDTVYATMWNRMDVELAQSILDTGVWDEVPVTWVQRQVAYDFIVNKAPEGPKQVRLEEV